MVILVLPGWNPPHSKRTAGYLIILPSLAVTSLWRQNKWTWNAVGKACLGWVSDLISVINTGRKQWWGVWRTANLPVHRQHCWGHLLSPPALGLINSDSQRQDGITETRLQHSVWIRERWMTSVEGAVGYKNLIFESLALKKKKHYWRRLQEKSCIAEKNSTFV